MPGLFDDLPSAKPAAQPAAPSGGMFDDLPDKPGFFEGSGNAVKSLLAVPASTARSLGHMVPALPPAVLARKIVSLFSGRDEAELLDEQHRQADALVDPSYFQNDRSRMGAGARFLDTGAQVVGAVPEMIGAPIAFLADAAMSPGTRAIDEGKDLHTAQALGGINLGFNALGMKAPATALPLLEKLGVNVGGNAAQLATRAATGAVANPALSVPQSYAEQALLGERGYGEDAARINPWDLENLAHQALLGSAFGVQEHVTAPRPGVLSPEIIERGNAALTEPPPSPEAVVPRQDMPEAPAGPDALTEALAPVLAALRGEAPAPEARRPQAKPAPSLPEIPEQRAPELPPEIAALLGERAQSADPLESDFAAVIQQARAALGGEPVTAGDVSAPARPITNPAPVEAPVRAPEPVREPDRTPPPDRLAPQAEAAPAETDADAFARELAAAQEALAGGPGKGVDFASPERADPAKLDEALALSDADYLARVNPSREATNAETSDALAAELHDREVPERATEVGKVGDITLHADGDYLYAADGERVVGVLASKPSGNEFAVDPEYRGRGIGQVMMKELLVRDPLALSGGLSPAAERTRLAARRQLQAERTSAPTAGDKPAAPADSGQPTTTPEPPRTTSLKREFVDSERERTGKDAIPDAEPRANADVVANARATLLASPERAAETVARLRSADAEGVTQEDAAILLAHSTDLRAKRDAAAKRALDESATEAQREAAQREWDELETQISEVDDASRTAGTEWGRIGQLYQQLMRDDFSLAALERKARKAKGGAPLTAEEHATLKAQAAAAEAATARAEAAEAKLREAESAAYGKALIEAMTASLHGAPKPPKGVPLGDRLKAQADAARERLRKKAGVLRSGVDPEMLVDVARVGAWHIYNGAREFSAWVARMREDFSAKVMEALDPHLAGIHAAAQAQVDAEAGKPAKSIDPQNITRRDVYNLALAKVQAGVKDLDPLMEAVAKDLQDAGADIDARTVRQLFTDYGKVTFPSKDADKATLRELRRIGQLQESIDRLREGQAALKSGPQRDKATARIRAKQAELNELLKAASKRQGVSAEQLATLQQARIANLKNQIEDLQRHLLDGTKPEKRTPLPETPEIKALKGQRDALRKELDALEKPKLSEAERYQRTRAKSIARQIADIEARLARGDYAKRPRVARELSAANEAAQFQLQKLKHEIATKLFEQEMARRTPLAKAWGTVGETFNFSRALMTSLDLSAVFRQGGFIALGHPVKAAKALTPMLRAALSAQAEHAINDEIASRPNARLYKRFGLELTEHSTHDVSKLEEAFASRWVDKVPAVLGGGLLRGSQRAYTTFLNRIRADAFDALVATLARDGKALTETEGKAIAGYINVATGRGVIGSKGRFNASAAALNKAFFAPRLVASRFNLLAGQPLYGGSNRTRKLIAAEYARFLTGVATVFALGMAAQDDEDRGVDLDPRSTNFLKLKFGDTYLDPMAGLAQVTTFVAREATGEKITTAGNLRPLRPYLTLSGARNTLADLLPQDLAPDGLRTEMPKAPKFGQDTGADIIGRFLRTKLAPIPGAVVDLSTGENVIGEKVTPGSAALSLVVPMSFRDIQGIMTDNGVPKGAALFALSLLGMGVQYRDPNAHEADTGSADNR